MKKILQWLVIFGILTFLLVILILGIDALFGLGWGSTITGWLTSVYHSLGSFFSRVYTSLVSGRWPVFILGTLTPFIAIWLIKKIKQLFKAAAGTSPKTILASILFNWKILLTATFVGFIIIIAPITYFYYRDFSGPDEGDLAIQKVQLYEEIMKKFQVPLPHNLTEENISKVNADEIFVNNFCQYVGTFLPKAEADYRNMVKGNPKAATCSIGTQTKTAAAPSVTDIPVTAPYPDDSTEESARSATTKDAPLPADADTIKYATVAEPTPFVPEASPKPAKPAAAAAPAKPAAAPATAKPKPAAASNSNSNRHAGDGRPIYGNVQTGEFQGVSNDNRGDLAPGPTNNNNDLAPGPPESQLTSDRGDLAPGPR